jgi:hypothetical protein
VRPGYRRGVDDRTRTSSVETAADPGSLAALLADAARIPGWAPARVYRRLPSGTMVKFNTEDEA